MKAIFSRFRKVGHYAFRYIIHIMLIYHYVKSVYQKVIRRKSYTEKKPKKEKKSKISNFLRLISLDFERMEIIPFVRSYIKCSSTTTSNPFIKNVSGKKVIWEIKSINHSWLCSNCFIKFITIHKL